MYQALYRKYRPNDFESVVGQNPIVKTLRNSIVHNSFSHAYMFFGPRGTGKTTVSKIFARNVNCLSPVDGNACGNCDSCNVSFLKECVDIIEIDAASNNGVDEIRELKSKISLVPAELKYKVYIIDEVHMLSMGAFNALLKTLEEPPEHAIFILATTDPQKVPDTIISRCQCFSFKRISSDVIKERLKYVCDVEKIDVDDDVLNSIALLSDGGMRDALGLLDKLSSYTDETITMDDFAEVNGLISEYQLEELLNSIMNGNIPNFLKSINQYDAYGKNLIQIIEQLLHYSRDIIVDNYLSKKNSSYSVIKLQKFVNLINERMFDIKRSNNPKIYIEIMLLEFMNDFIENSVVEKVDTDSSNVKNGDVNTTDKNVDIKKKLKEEKEISIEKNKSNVEDSDISSLNEDIKILNIDDIINARVNNIMALADKKLLKDELNNFDKLSDYTFDQEFGFLVCSLMDSTLRAVSPNGIIISFLYDSTVKQNLPFLNRLTEVYNDITKSNKKIAIVSDDDWNRLKNEYIDKLKNGIRYEVVEEPEAVLEVSDKSDIISSSAIELFGDIVEIE